MRLVPAALFLLSVQLCGVSALEAQAPLDFDSDGTSDIGLVEQQSDGSANELVYHLQLSQSDEDLRIEFGKRSDLQVHGSYDSDGVFDLAVVRVEDGALYWHIRSSSDGSVNSFKLGQAGDIVLGGCSFDSDPAADPAVLGRGRLRYNSSAAGGERVRVTLDLPEMEKIVSLHCGDRDGDGVDELLLLEAAAGRRKAKKLLYLKIFSAAGELLEETRVRRATSLFALDVNDDGSEEPAYFRRRRRGVSRLTFHFDGDAAPLILKLPRFSDLSAAQLIGPEGAPVPGFALLSRERLLHFNMLSLSSEVAVQRTANRLLLKAVNIHFTDGSPPKEDPGPKQPSDENPPDDGGDGKNGGLCRSVHSAFDGSEGFLWKEADHGGLVVLFPREYQSEFQKVEVAKDGKVFGVLYYTGKANGDRQHWRHQNHSGSFPDEALVVAHGSSGADCWRIGDSSARND